MSESCVIFKGTVNGLTILLKEEVEFRDILEEMEAKIRSAGKFFRGASLFVKYKGRKLTKSEEDAIYSLLSDKSGAEIKGIEEEQEETVPPISNEVEKPRNRLDIRKFYYFKGTDEGVTRFYRGTVRSGQLINYDGNLVVIGDVNPGGVVEATGNVIVLGTLRGVVHAGADGNKEAVVVAFNLQPTQLRIADVITRSPDEADTRGQMVPELAYVKDDTVYIERYLPQK